MKYFLLLLVVLIAKPSFSQHCELCDLNILIEVSDNLNHLDYEHVENFVCTQNMSCGNNVEFSQMSNELLFDIIEKDIDLLNDVLRNFSYKYLLLIVKELQDPVKEEDLKKIYNLILNANGTKEIKSAMLKAIKNAAFNEGVKL